MINNNVLADRLNAVKNGEDIPPVIGNTPTSINTNVKTTEIDFIEEIKDTVIILVSTSIRALLFGGAAQTLFQTDWTFLGMFAIGATTSILISEIHNIFTKK